MKAALICPGNRPALQAAGAVHPLVLLPVLGKTLLEYWLDDLFDHGARHVYLLVCDGADQIKAWLHDATQWEMRLEIVQVERELTPAAARAFCQVVETDWMPQPGDVSVVDYFPGARENPLFKSYAGWFKAVTAWLPRAVTAPDRIGLRQIKPGVWAGLRSRVSDDAVLESPCWLGEGVLIGPGARVGPGAILEDGVVISSGAEVSESFVGPHTRVGELTEIKRSLVFGNHLINWETDSCITVDEPFLLCDMQTPFPAGQFGHLLDGAVAVTRPGLRRLSGLYQSLKAGLSQAAEVGPGFAQMKPAPFHIPPGSSSRPGRPSRNGEGAG